MPHLHSRNLLAAVAFGLSLALFPSTVSAQVIVTPAAPVAVPVPVPVVPRVGVYPARPVYRGYGYGLGPAPFLRVYRRGYWPTGRGVPVAKPWLRRW